MERDVYEREELKEGGMASRLEEMLASVSLPLDDESILLLTSGDEIIVYDGARLEEGIEEIVFQMKNPLRIIYSPAYFVETMARQDHVQEAYVRILGSLFTRLFHHEGDTLVEDHPPIPSLRFPSGGRLDAERVELTREMLDDGIKLSMMLVYTRMLKHEEETFGYSLILQGDDVHAARSVHQLVWNEETLVFTPDDHGIRIISGGVVYELLYRERVGRFILTPSSGEPISPPVRHRLAGFVQRIPYLLEEILTQ